MNRSNFSNFITVISPLEPYSKKWSDNESSRPTIDDYYPRQILDISKRSTDFGFRLLLTFTGIKNRLKENCWIRQIESLPRETLINLIGKYLFNIKKMLTKTELSTFIEDRLRLIEDLVNHYALSFEQIKKAELKFEKNIAKLEKLPVSKFKIIQKVEIPVKKRIRKSKDSKTINNTWVYQTEDNKLDNEKNEAGSSKNFISDSSIVKKIKTQKEDAQKSDAKWESKFLSFYICDELRKIEGDVGKIDQIETNILFDRITDLVKSSQEEYLKLRDK